MRGDVRFQKILELFRDTNWNAMVGRDRIARVLKNLKNFARLDEVELQKVDQHDGLDSSLALLHHELKDPISVVKDYGDIQEVTCYPSELNQVFIV